MTARPDRSLFERPAAEVAPRLLGMILHHAPEDGEAAAGRIVEVEAYAQHGDPASHSANGQTLRNASMFGTAGTLYVYRIYGLHWCANVVCGQPGVGDAVLIRALHPTEGLDAMRRRRGPSQRPLRDADLCSGPAKLCQALGIGGDRDGTDLLGAGPVRLTVDPACGADLPLAQSTRIGISRGVDLPWRWHVVGSPHVSRARPVGETS